MRDLVGEAVSCDHLLLPSLMGYLQSRSFLAVLHLNPLFFLCYHQPSLPHGQQSPFVTSPHPSSHPFCAQQEGGVYDHAIKDNAYA